MSKESTPPAQVGAQNEAPDDDGEALLAAVARLGLPEVARSRGGRPVFAGLAGAAGGQRPGPAPLIVMAGIHGNEPASVAAVLDLLAGWQEVRPARPTWLVPALNPDGLAANLKNSAADVDLNRNFAARNFSRAHAPGYDPGPAGLSEPETAAFAALVERLGPWGVVAVHAPFACINHDGPAGPWAEAVAAACGWPARADIGYPTPGSLGSWLGVDLGIPVLTIELPPGGLRGFRAAAFAALAAAVNWDPDRAAPAG